MSDANLSNLFYGVENVFGENVLTRQSGTFTLTGQPVSGQTVTIDGKVYTFRGSVITLTADGDVLIGAAFADTALNLIAAINLDPSKAGVTYASAMTAPARVFAETGGVGIVTVKAVYPGALLGLVKASGVLTFAGVAANNDTVTIDGKVYTFQTVLTDVDGHVLIGADIGESCANLVKAITLGAGAGVKYATTTTSHPSVTAVVGNDEESVTVTALVAGTAGNSIATTETGGNIGFAAVTLLGGTNDTIATTDTAANASWGAATLTGGTGVALALTEIRFTGESLTAGKDTVQSEEIRDDRSVSELVEVGRTSRGTVNSELHAQGLDIFILAALMASAWVSETNAAASLAINPAAGKIVNNDGAFSAIVRGARVIRVVQDDGTYSGDYYIDSISQTTVANDTINFTRGAYTTGANHSTTGSFKVRYARNGVALRTFMLMKQFLSIFPSEAVACFGKFLNKFDLTLDPKAIAKVAMEFGGTEQAESPGSFGKAGPTAPPTTPIFNTSSNVGTIHYGGSAVGSPISKFALSINNNLADRNVLTRLTTLSPRKGTAVITGSLTSYFENRNIFKDFLAHTSRAIECPLKDSLGNLINVFMPKCSFSAASPLVPGINTDLMIPLNFQAVQGANGYMIQIDSILA